MNSTRTEEGEEKKSVMSEGGIYGRGKQTGFPRQLVSSPQVCDDILFPGNWCPLLKYVMTFCILEANDQVTYVMNTGGHHIWLYLSLSHPASSKDM